jgi:hypothetical protein
MSDVVVLGCGPTGLLVAWAVEQAGHTPRVISRKEKSVIPGSQHLHGPVPGITSQYPEGTIQFVRLGTAEGYAKKVYQDAERETGWDNYLQVYPSWNVLEAYDKLWEHFEGQIIDQEIRGGAYRLQQLYELITSSDLIISTLPAKAICHDPAHIFKGTQYWIKQLPTPEADREHEIVVYNGLLTDPWYRWSILGGLCSIEYTYEGRHALQRDDGENWISGFKAIENNCDCWPDIARCGRWAEWTHGVTMFKAYHKAVGLMEAIR